MLPPRSWSQLVRAAGHAVFHCRDVLATVAILLLVICTRHTDFIAPARYDRWLEGSGLVAVVVGLAVRFLVIASSGIRRSGVHKRVVAPTLYDVGAYAWCRNPLYVANGVILVGLTALFDSRWMVGIALPAALLAIRSIVAAEERVLAESFGARYRDYCLRIPRFLPHRPFALVAVRPLDWRRAVRKEHGTVFAAVTTAVALLAAKDLARAQTYREAVLVSAWLVAAALWTVVRHRKRRGRLHEAPVSSQMSAPPPTTSRLTPTPAPRAPLGDVAA